VRVAHAVVRVVMRLTMYVVPLVFVAMGVRPLFSALTMDVRDGAALAVREAGTFQYA